MSTTIWLRAPLHGFTRVYVAGLPALAMGSYACPLPGKKGGVA